MTSIDKLNIIHAATGVLRSHWQERHRIWVNPPNADGLLPIPVDKIARDLLGLSLEEPEEILFAHSEDKYEVAGFLDRGERRIVVAQKFRPEWRRFTLAHEVAHWILHPKITHHRDRPLTGGERANQTRPHDEQEADVFASELLMPEKALRRKFTAAFGSPFDGREPDSTAAFWLSAGSNRHVNEIQLSADLRYRAMIIAQTASFAGRHFTPLSTVFGVSPTALAIQLEDLGLVI